MASRDRIGEIMATVTGALVMLFVWGSIFIVLGTISLDKVLAGKGSDPFRLGNVPIPKFQGAGASYLDIVIFSGIGLLAIVIVIIRRYLHHRKTLEEFRSKGITDVDGDGKIDSFADDFLDDL